jgi:hypothetical protein
MSHLNPNIPPNPSDSGYGAFPTDQLFGNFAFGNYSTPGSGSDIFGNFGEFAPFTGPGFTELWDWHSAGRDWSDPLNPEFTGDGGIGAGGGGYSPILEGPANIGYPYGDNNPVWIQSLIGDLLSRGMPK